MRALFITYLMRRRRSVNWIRFKLERKTSHWRRPRDIRWLNWRSSGCATWLTHPSSGFQGGKALLFTTDWCANVFAAAWKHRASFKKQWMKRPSWALCRMGWVWGLSMELRAGDVPREWLCCQCLIWTCLSNWLLSGEKTMLPHCSPGSWLVCRICLKLTHIRMVKAQAMRQKGSDRDRRSRRKLWASESENRAAGHQSRNVATGTRKIADDASHRPSDEQGDNR